MSMNSRQRVQTALSHQSPDYVPLDLGASPVTGMHVSSVYQLRQALKLDEPGTPVKVVEPYQMLGHIAPDLLDALRVDVVELAGRTTFFGFENKDWKPWTTCDDTPVLVPGNFNIEPEPSGDILMYPEGDHSAPASGRMPKGGFYFDTIVRQEPIDEENLNVEDNLQEFGPISDEDLEHFARGAERLRAESDRAILANFGGTAFGDIALVPAPWLKYPKGIRDVEERQCGDCGVHHGHRFRHAERSVHQSYELSQAVPAVPSARERLGPRAHSLENVHPFVRLDHGVVAGYRRRRL
jgi:hypothetical protein